MPLLTVAIPTYNRLDWLKRSLAEVIAQAAPLSDIEVLVSDNCSTDGTWPYLEALAAAHGILRLNRNPQNIGGEGNFYLLPQLATGRYLYMIGDDDILEPGALGRIMTALRDEPDYLVINFAAYDSELQVCMDGNVLNLSEDRAIKSQKECLDLVDPMAMSFISLWVARRDFFNILSESEYRHFTQWGMSIQADRYFGTARFPKGQLIATPGVKARRADVEFDFFAWFLHGSAQVFRYAVEKGAMNRANVAGRKAKLIRLGVKRILYERWAGTFDRQRVFTSLRRDFGELWQFWLLAVPAMFVPGLGVLAGWIQQKRGRLKPRTS